MAKGRCKSPISRYGGKFYMKDKIVNLFPEHEIYVEGFGGAGHVLFYKEPSLAEVYNDIDEELYKFFSLIKVPELRKELVRRFQLTLYSRYEFEQSKIILPSDDEVEKVRKCYVNTMMSVNGLGKNFSRSMQSRGGMAQNVNRFINHVDKDIDECGRVLEEDNIFIENLDIIELIDKYDSPDTLFYLDPPYLHDTRVNTDAYDFEMTDTQHIKMLDRLKYVEGKVIISGYDNKIYRNILVQEFGWNKIKLGDYAKRSSTSKTKSEGEEIVWFNYDLGE